MLLVEIDGNGKFIVNKEAEDILKKIEEPIKVVCISGQYRTGKSFLMNRFVNNKDAFEVGPSVNPCSKGITIWGKPLVTSSGPILLLDTEGLYSGKRTAAFDMKIFSLAVLLSSVMI